MLTRGFLQLISTVFALVFATVISTTSYTGIAYAESGTASKCAEDKVKTIYPEFKGLVNSGSNEAEMTKFFEDNFDTSAISSRFCGTQNSKLIKSLVRFLLWRLKTEAIQTVKTLDLVDDMSTTEKANSISVKCNLTGGKEPIELKVIFTKTGGSIGKIKELVVVGIPLIEGATPIMKQYFEKNAIKINAIKDPVERAEKCTAALDNFVKRN